MPPSPKKIVDDLIKSDTGSKKITEKTYFQYLVGLVSEIPARDIISQVLNANPGMSLKKVLIYSILFTSAKIPPNLKYVFDVNLIEPGPKIIDGGTPLQQLGFFVKSKEYELPIVLFGGFDPRPDIGTWVKEKHTGTVYKLQPHPVDVAAHDITKEAIKKRYTLFKKSYEANRKHDPNIEKTFANIKNAYDFLRKLPKEGLKSEIDFDYLEDKGFDWSWARNYMNKEYEQEFQDD
jgi:hypothetical protein